jgi:hypothetical protein
MQAIEILIPHLRYEFKTAIFIFPQVWRHDNKAPLQPLIGVVV